MNQRFWGLAPRNLEQAMAMRLLDCEDVDMTVLTGPAGSGKTLLALALWSARDSRAKEIQQIDCCALNAADCRGNRVFAGNRGREDGALVGGF